jgi:8-oxo-dGTP pyrophosphatase MutT (NUDIX family)
VAATTVAAAGPAPDADGPGVAIEAASYSRPVTEPSGTFATSRVAAGALFLDPTGRVLLVRPIYKDSWEIPGGCVESGESPAAACRRELAEELGLHREPRRLIAVDWAPNDRDGDKLLFLFDCGVLGDDEHRIRLGADELDRWEWVSLDHLDDYLIPRLARRVRSAATLDGTTGVYLEHGRPVTRS